MKKLSLIIILVVFFAIEKTTAQQYPIDTTIVKLLAITNFRNNNFPAENVKVKTLGQKRYILYGEANGGNPREKIKQKTKSESYKIEKIIYKDLANKIIIIKHNQTIFRFKWEQFKISKKTTIDGLGMEHTETSRKLAQRITFVDNFMIVKTFEKSEKTFKIYYKEK